jgi:hypothetical protein
MNYITQHQKEKRILKINSPQQKLWIRIYKSKTYAAQELKKISAKFKSVKFTA